MRAEDAQPLCERLLADTVEHDILAFVYKVDAVARAEICPLLEGFESRCDRERLDLFDAQAFGFSFGKEDFVFLRKSDDRPPLFFVTR